MVKQVNGRVNGVDISQPELNLILGDPANVAAAASLLVETESLFDQIDLLYYLHSCRGPHFMIKVGEESVSVSDLLEEVYEKAAHHRLWGIVRQAAGLLKKVVNSLTINITDILIRQIQITIGSGDSGISIS